METNPEKIIANILADMAEIGDWASIADALAANGRNSHFASREEVMAILRVLKKSPEISVGKVEGGFLDLPDDWDPAEVADQIFSDPQPVGAMMETFIRPTGEWPQREDGAREETS
ncbi:hypothetical protein [Corynebacterium liangguodongii]|uniref:Uncharacterized protein n=1 Tax=Corynebacterium liangguodongii TaxID=2079535 RepID=A0A2S0WBJ2_9CORY|nr:hypothetical protein [Corynebacterium liangguodongii]AWB83138.1 hypothetical protein C3E79_00415 [Corynebacterium liangguodongii]PWB98586.1 hypothetical protein DF219_11105 [Corynebacterium liangguodongii]